MKILSLGLVAVAISVAIVAYVRYAGGYSLHNLLSLGSVSLGCLGISSAVWPWGHAKQAHQLPQEPSHKVSRTYTQQEHKKAV